jgi:DNA-binding transcriptional MerR regulator
VPRKSQFLTTGQAARLLGISPKALRLYEQQHLITPGRTAAGWRVYGPTDMERAKDIVSLRKLGLGIAEISALIDADPSFRGAALARHQSRLESQMRQLGGTLREIDEARSGLRTCPKAQSSDDPAIPRGQTAVSFDLPWPWGGERFSLLEPPSLIYITGPLGSGKTRLAMRLAEALPGGHFLGLDRLDPIGRFYGTVLCDDADLSARCGLLLDRLVQNGATLSPALQILVAALCATKTPLVIDMIEQGLDHPTQLALASHLYHLHDRARPLVVMTRSTAILDLASVESGETIIYCPANHGPPMIVRADPACPGYEAVATCLATPDVRARTSGVVATWLANAE